MGLSINQILLLNEFNGREKNYRLSQYKKEKFGKHPYKIIYELTQEGYLTFTTPAQSLSYLTIPALKKILRENNQKVSGNKSTLVERIIATIDEDNWNKKVPRHYVLTPAGEKELSDNYIFILNEKLMLGFLNSELLAAKNNYIKQNNYYNMEAVLLEVFGKKISELMTARDWGLVRNQYFNLSSLFEFENKLTKAIQFLLLVKYMDYSGMGNNNMVEEYDSLNWVSQTSISSQIDKLMVKADILINNIDVLYFDALKNIPRLPFQYFSDADVLNFIKDELLGKSFDPSLYEYKHNIPIENHADYSYFTWKHNRSPKEIAILSSPEDTSSKSSIWGTIKKIFQ